jgi:hypothetical protein
VFTRYNILYVVKTLHISSLYASKGTQSPLREQKLNGLCPFAYSHHVVFIIRRLNSKVNTMECNNPSPTMRVTFLRTPLLERLTNLCGKLCVREIAAAVNAHQRVSKLPVPPLTPYSYVGLITLEVA